MVPHKSILFSMASISTPMSVELEEMAGDGESQICVPPWASDLLFLNFFLYTLSSNVGYGMTSKNDATSKGFPSAILWASEEACSCVRAITADRMVQRQVSFGPWEERTLYEALSLSSLAAIGCLPLDFPKERGAP